MFLRENTPLNRTSHNGRQVSIDDDDDDDDDIYERN